MPRIEIQHQPVLPTGLPRPREYTGEFEETYDFFKAAGLFFLSFFFFDAQNSM
jgi:hypothetical protein